MDVKRVMVIGAGQMGTGIAQVFAQANYRVLLHDVHEEALDKGMKSIQNRLKRLVEKGRITMDEKVAILKRLIRSRNLADAKNQDLIIEAVVEDMDTKKQLFQRLALLAPSYTILASNTSSLSITEISSVTNCPEKVIGMHFMNPAPVMQLVEVIRGLKTSDDTYETIEHVTKKLQKTPVEVNDFPGFVSNRILMPMINEAIYAVYEGVASKEAVDQVMTLGMNHPMGPLTLADFIGLDTCLSIMNVLYEGFGDSKYRPCPLLKRYVSAGLLGQKTGEGFFKY